jgi:hypothetical protein
MERGAEAWNASRCGVFGELCHSLLLLLLALSVGAQANRDQNRVLPARPRRLGRRPARLVSFLFLLFTCVLCLIDIHNFSGWQDGQCRTDDGACYGP